MVIKELTDKLKANEVLSNNLSLEVQNLKSNNSGKILFYYIPTINTANFIQLFTIKSAPTDFTTNKICSYITSSICKSVCIHMLNAVTLIGYE